MERCYQSQQQGFVALSGMVINTATSSSLLWVLFEWMTARIEVLICSDVNFVIVANWKLCMMTWSSQSCFWEAEFRTSVKPQYLQLKFSCSTHRLLSCSGWAQRVVVEMWAWVSQNNLDFYFLGFNASPGEACVFFWPRRVDFCCWSQFWNGEALRSPFFWQGELP